MAVPPLVTCGPFVSSGGVANAPPNYQIQGGTRLYTNYSGQAGDAITIWSGTGILNTIQVITRTTSGTAIYLQDAAGAAVVSGLGGFAANSGIRTLGVVPPTYDQPMVSGAVILDANAASRPLVIGAPFYSGLACGGQSGSTGVWSCTFTPLPNPS